MNLFPLRRFIVRLTRLLVLPLALLLALQIGQQRRLRAELRELNTRVAQQESELRFLRTTCATQFGRLAREVNLHTRIFQETAAGAAAPGFAPPWLQPFEH